MAYSFSDVTGKTVGDGPCINGLRELKAFVKEQDPDSKLFPAVADLLEDGYTNSLMQLGVDCRNLISRCKDPNIKSTFQSMTRSAKKAQEILIMEDA